MTKQFSIYILLPLILIGGASISSAQNIQVEAKLQDYTIKLGDQTRFFLQVHQPVNARVNFPRLTDSLSSKVLIVSANKPDTVVDKKHPSQETVTQTYIITSFDAGVYTIPSFSFGSAVGQLQSNEQQLQVQTVKVDTTKAVYDIKRPLKVSYTFLDMLRDNWYWVVIPAVVVLALIALFVYLKKRPKKEVTIEVKKPLIPAHIIALNKLTAMRDKKLWQQENIKQYYVDLSDVLREYLENRYVIKTHEKTTDEIFASLRHVSLSNDNRNLLKQLLVLADLVKFAKEKPLAMENELNIERAIAFVNNTSEQLINEMGGDGGNV